MEGSVGTSASSARTLYQSQAYSEPASQSWEFEQNVPPQRPGHTGDASSASDATECAHCAVLGMNTSGSCVSGTACLRASALVLPAPSESPGISRSPSVYSASESSLPSVSSSFFFSSSAPGSPGRSHPSSYPSSHPHSDHEYDHEQGLIIPSLALPDALRRPTAFGQTLGTLKVLVLGGQGAGKSFLTGLLLEDNEDVVEVGTWEDWHSGEEGGAGAYAYGKVLRASTDWLEQHEVFGLERFEPARNVEIVELPGYSHDADATELITRLKGIIETPFHTVHDVLHPETEPSGLVARLLTASSSPLYTAMILLLPSSPTPLDREIIVALSSHIPLIVLPRLHGSHRAQQHGGAPFPTVKLSRFRPASAVALRNGLFHSPETVNLLRCEAVDRFLKWREVERAVEEIWNGSTLWEPAMVDGAGRKGRDTIKGGKQMSGIAGRRLVARRLREKDWGRSQMADDGDDQDKQDEKTEVWDKAKWEAEWMESHSQDVAKRMRQGTITKRNSQRSHKDSAESAIFKIEHDQTDDRHAASEPRPAARRGAPDQAHAPFDPLHLPSLFFFSISLLEPLKIRIGDSLARVVEALNEARVRFALLGGFCVGLRVGVWVKTL